MPLPKRADFRQRSKYLLGLGSELVRPILRKAARIRSAASARPPREWRRGLILGHTRIGDVLYRTSSLEVLKRGLPGCEWFYLAATDSAILLENNPALPRVLPWCHSFNSLDVEPQRWQELQSIGFDVALCTNAEGYWRDLYLALKLRIPNRVAYT